MRIRRGSGPSGRRGWSFWTARTWRSNPPERDEARAAPWKKWFCSLFKRGEGRAGEVRGHKRENQAHAVVGVSPARFDMSRCGRKAARSSLGGVGHGGNRASSFGGAQPWRGASARKTQRGARRERRRKQPERREGRGATTGMAWWLLLLAGKHRRGGGARATAWGRARLDLDRGGRRRRGCGGEIEGEWVASAAWPGAEDEVERWLLREEIPRWEETGGVAAAGRGKAPRF